MNFRILLATIGLMTFAAVGFDPACAQDAPATQIDPVKLGLARQLVELSGGEKQADAQITALFNAIKTSMGRYQSSSDQKELVSMFYDEIAVDMHAITPKLLDLNAKIYAENYTEKELRDAIAFEASDSGQAITRKSPAIRAESVARVTPSVMAFMPDLMRKVMDNVCAQKHCTARQRQLIDSSISQVFKPQS